MDGLEYLIGIISVCLWCKRSAFCPAKFRGSYFYDLFAAASREALTEAARALTKHTSGQRATGTFPKLSGGIEKKNATALGTIDEILKNPNSTFSNLSRGGLEVRAPYGRGLRYNSDGSFSGFLDPKAKP